MQHLLGVAAGQISASYRAEKDYVPREGKFLWFFLLSLRFCQPVIVDVLCLLRRASAKVAGFKKK